MCERLYRDWEEEVDCYAINVPLCRTLEAPEIIYTKMWDSKYGRVSSERRFTGLPYLRYLEPDSFHIRVLCSCLSFAFLPQLFRTSSSRPTTPGSDVSRPTSYSHQPSNAPVPLSHFQFGPDMAHLLSPPDLQKDTDVWALMNGFISITRLGASFEKRGKDVVNGRREGEKWKL